MNLLADVGFSGWASGMGWVGLCILIIIVVGVATVLYLILTEALGWSPPPWFMKVFWVVVACFVGIVAIRLIASM